MRTFARPPDVRRKAGVAAVLGAAVALAAACGSQAAPGNASGPGSAGSRPASSLTITVAAAQGATPRHWTLTCGPGGDGGTHPRPTVACAMLTRAKDPFAPVPRGVMCPMIYGGPQAASIRGIWDGKRVATTYSRVNGCQTARWNKIWKVLGRINPGGPMIPAGGTPSG
jgi:Subtilisin inhibitor-like